MFIDLAQDCLSYVTEEKRIDIFKFSDYLNSEFNLKMLLWTEIYSYFQEYPPGVILVPMQSRTAKPFHTTNLVIFAPENVSDTSGDYSFVAYGDALIVDPGCRHEYHEEVWNTCLLPLVLPHFVRKTIFNLSYHLLCHWLIFEVYCPS